MYIINKVRKVLLNTVKALSIKPLGGGGGGAYLISGPKRGGLLERGV